MPSVEDIWAVETIHLPSNANSSGFWRIGAGDRDASFWVDDPANPEIDVIYLGSELRTGECAE